MKIAKTLLVSALVASALTACSGERAVLKSDSVENLYTSYQEVMKDAGGIKSVVGFKDGFKKIAMDAGGERLVNEVGMCLDKGGESCENLKQNANAEPEYKAKLDKLMADVNGKNWTQIADVAAPGKK